jgi:hypothetical protein
MERPDYSFSCWLGNFWSPALKNATRTAARELVIGNILFWLIFSVFFIMKSYPTKPHTRVGFGFEEAPPNLIYFGRAFCYFQDSQTFEVARAIHLVQMPSFYAASPLNWYLCHRRGMVVDDVYLGISEGGYYWLVVCMFSFLQWYLIGIIIDHLISRPMSGRVNFPESSGIA